MGTLSSAAVAAKKSSLTPKAIISQKFGSKASYKVDEVEESFPNECPGLAIRQKGRCLYRCHLQLPELSVVSGTFARKKDAEQAAAEKAIEMLGIHVKENNPTEEEARDELVDRLAYLFSSEFLSSGHPLSGHFRAVLKRKGHLNGCIPISVMAMYDAKLTNLCKHINPEVESNPLGITSIILSAAEKLSGSLLPLEDHLSLKRQSPHPPDVLQSVENCESTLPESFEIQAIRIPSSVNETIETLVLNLSSASYYLDVIAEALGVTEASRVQVSRTIGKASSEIRLFFCPKQQLLDQSLEPLEVHRVQLQGSLNVRASYFAGQEVYGDAILASVGYVWKSANLFHEDMSMRTYYRLLINKIPSGVYKLSREAISVAELPMAFTTRSNWRGFFPREILYTFCRQHRLAEPVFCIPNSSLGTSTDPHGTCKKLKVTEPIEEGKKSPVLAAGGGGESDGLTGDFQCEVKIFSKCQDLILQFLSTKAYKKQTDAVQNAALKVLLWLNLFFRESNISSEKLSSHAKELGIQFYSEYFLKEFNICSLVHDFWMSFATVEDGLLDRKHMKANDDMVENGVFSLNMGGQASGVNPSSGSLVCIGYTSCLVTEGGTKEHLESNEQFEFEMGIGAVVPCIEGIVTQLSVGQSACFGAELPPLEFILAAADDSPTTISLLSSGKCSLEHTITLLRVTEPLEDRMEQALFSPPLSKQRVEYALQHIQESHALSMIDFGCGSGSLLDSLLDYPTSLDKIVGVDISQKSLARAAKMLHSKLNSKLDYKVSSNRIKSAVLYDGSITNFDSRLCGFDIGTCLEVIEHMEEQEASLFGDVVLSSFCPRILIISTPNYEYNVILQKSAPQNQEEDPDEKNQSQAYKFRNHDHKFEWTRAQFCDWATDLSRRHNYSVEFSGVGGVGDVEPGFASQIAVFRRKEENPKNVEIAHHCKVIWEWSEGDRSKSAL
ncbi:small RNA 2'-O-methyltransferase-like isoform X1 [Coffea arabica]|uniref:Small RNA 2'-O-methyltransferase n=2 Tax=Coffea arabica TaxID=13443 RepID=A0A6P6UHG8_COFAR|nr:small RNA 2'-O-methyltransferase-like [Coffea arabica]XP_027089663.1 small RNA 2'-O-methyltransferase-like [Coffea arabica]XP_027089664.1 small RNA 2'-O-methyltransferase-like [Coffea arabica]